MLAARDAEAVLRFAADLPSTRSLPIALRAADTIWPVVENILDAT